MNVESFAPFAQRKNGGSRVYCAGNGFSPGRRGHYCFAVGLVILALLEMAALFHPVKSRAETMDVPLTVINSAEYERVNAIITAGLPIPRRWGIVDPVEFRIVDDTGRPLAAQLQVTGRWAGSTDSSGPIKWVLASFLASVPPKSDKTFHLTTGQHCLPTSTLQVEKNSQDRLVIATGAGTFTLNKKAFGLFDEVQIGSQQVVNSSSPGEFFIVSKDGKTYSSRNDTPCVFTIEQKGPLTLTVRVEGRLRDAKGTPLTDYTAWFTFFADNNAVRVLYTMGNHNKAKVKGTAYDVYDYYGGNSITFTAAGVRLRLNKGSSPVRFLLPGDKQLLSGDVTLLSVYQDSSGTDYWARYGSVDHPRPNSYVSFRGYRVENGGTVLDSGDHYQGWIDCGDDAKGITLALVDFWQNYPKGFSCAADGTLSVDLFPDRYAGDYNFRVGEEKTTEMWFLFHRQNENPAQRAEKARGLTEPLRAWAAPEWYAASGALPPFLPASGNLESRFGKASQLDDYGKYEYFNDRTLIRDPRDEVYTYYAFHSLWLSGNGSPSAADYFNFYGWNAYGNQPLDFEMYDEGKAGYFNSKYDFNWGTWIQFLRTGDPRWEMMAEAFSRHLEQIMLHEVITETGYDVYRWKNALFGHAQHYEPGNVNGPRNHLGPVMDTAWGVRGTLLHYHLTGYPPSLRFALDAAEYAYNFYLDRFESDYLWEGYERYAGNLLSILTEAWKFTGDIKYSQLARRLMDHYAPELQPYINGPVDSTSFVMPWMMGLYLDAMGRYARVADEYGMTEESRTAKERLAIFAQWLCRYVIFECRGWTTVNYRYNVNGDNDPDDGIFSNWLLDLADSLAYAFDFTNDVNYLKTARRLFATAVNNPSYEGSPLDYFTVKEAVNHAVFGHVFLASSLQLDNDGDSVDDDGSADDGCEGDVPGDNGLGPHACQGELLLNREANEGLKHWDTKQAKGRPKFSKVRCRTFLPTLSEATRR